ncbi:MAG: DKNYY domain-containing protein [Saprospiraceae bacterium]
MHKIGIVFSLFITLVSCDAGYKKENGTWVWVSYDEGAGRRVNPINLYSEKSFTVLRNKDYAKDKQAVFYKGGEIKGADPKTFEVINKGGYSKDEHNIFLDREKVIFANPNSFQLLEFPYAKDEDNVFCGTIPMKLSREEVQEFKVTNEDKLMAGMKTSTILSHFIELNPEYNWLDTFGMVVVITGEWGTGETNTRKFKGFQEIEKAE